MKLKINPEHAPGEPWRPKTGHQQLREIDSFGTSAALNGAYSESDLPWKVDVVDWISTSNYLKKVVERKGCYWQKKGWSECVNGEDSGLKR